MFPKKKFLIMCPPHRASQTDLMCKSTEKTDICNFADDNTISSCAKSVNDVIENLQSDLNLQSSI